MQTMNNPLISVVSPVYKGEKMVQELVSRIGAAVGTITEDYEIILVNDASPDGSWEAICRICDADEKVVGVNLSRNFGQHYAITAGLQQARGEWTVVMDCDLQDRPEEIPNLYQKTQEGYDSVLAQRIVRHDTFFKRLSSKCFYKVFSYLTDTTQDSSVANFGIYNRKVIDSILQMGDAVKYFPTQVQWVGYKRTYLPVEHAERAEGKSTYNFKRLLHLAFDSMISFSDKPLRLTVKLGFIITALAFIAGIWFLIRWLNGSIAVLGYTSIMISIWLLAGVLISLLGVIGLYIGKMFEKAKDRPVYIVSEIRNAK